jgi:hypothetical protein
MRTRYVATAVLAGAFAVSVASCGGSGAGTGPVRVVPRTQIAKLSGKDTAVAVQPALLTMLKTLGITVSSTGKATVSSRYGPSTMVFPITGGSVTVYDKAQVTPYVQGAIDHDGSGLRFAGKGKTFAVGDFDVDAGTSSLTATVTQRDDARMPLFTLDDRDLVVTVNDLGQAHLDGIKVALSATAAKVLDRTFGVTAFRPAMLIGVAHITAS